MINLHSVELIDTATNVAESMPIGDLPRQPHVGSDGKQAYITDLGHHCFWVLDPANKTIMTTVDLGRDPEALALSADEEFLQIADYLAPTLTVISLASRAQPEPRLITGHTVAEGREMTRRARVGACQCATDPWNPTALLPAARQLDP